MPHYSTAGPRPPLALRLMRWAQSQTPPRTGHAAFTIPLALMLSLLCQPKSLLARDYCPPEPTREALVSKLQKTRWYTRRHISESYGGKKSIPQNVEVELEDVDWDDAWGYCSLTIAIKQLDKPRTHFTLYPKYIDEDGREGRVDTEARFRGMFDRLFSSSRLDAAALADANDPRTFPEAAVGTTVFLRRELCGGAVQYNNRHCSPRASRCKITGYNGPVLYLTCSDGSGVDTQGLLGHLSHRSRFDNLFSLTPLDASGPILLMTSNSDSDAPSFLLTGTASDSSGISYVNVNGRPAQVAPDGSFSFLTMLNTGDNELRVSAADNEGNETALSTTVTYHTNGLSADSLLSLKVRGVDDLVAERLVANADYVESLSIDQLLRLSKAAVAPGLLAAAVRRDSRRQRISLAEVRALLAKGLPPLVVAAVVESAREKPTLSASDVLELTSEGVDRNVILTLLAKPTPTPVPDASVPQSRVSAASAPEPVLPFAFQSCVISFGGWGGVIGSGFADVRFLADSAGTYNVVVIGSGIHFGASEVFARTAGPAGGYFLLTQLTKQNLGGRQFFTSVRSPSGAISKGMCSVN